jgi:tRNA G18 (ribose-2'-O)-methylase SpoU
LHRKLTTTELNRLSAPEFRALEKFPVIILLDNVRSGLNVGSIFRSADAFNVEKVVCCGITPVPPNRDVLKSALGSTETVVWEYASSAIESINQLKAQGVLCYAVEQTEQSMLLHQFVLQSGKRYALVLGNEVDGVDQSVIDACHGTIEVKQFGTKHSLNVAVCGGIVLHELLKTS